jgi:excisionase family DNA binding protein
MTVNEAAEALGCCPATVRRMVASGALKHYRVGRRGLRIPDAAVADLLAGQRVTPPRTIPAAAPASDWRAEWAKARASARR